MENARNNITGAKVLITCGVLLVSIATAFWMLSAKTLDSHECFVSIAAREMVQSGDWVLPTCNGQPRLQKTPLSYWLVAGLAKISGKVDEFTARFPSAVFAVLSAVFILYFVNEWLSFRIAAISTVVWATSLGYIRCSHSARPDMALAFFITVCFLTFYSAVTTQNHKRQVVYMLIFWVSFALGNLAKGPAPLPLVLIPLFFYIAINRQWKVLPKLLPVIGVIILLAVVLPWPLVIAHRVNWNLTLWKREFIDRFFGDYAPGHYPIFYYLLIMFKYVTPWVVFLPIALIAPFCRSWNKKQAAMEYLWLWFVVDLVFLTIDAGKRQHYILPLMPAMAILIGILLEDMAFVREGSTGKFAGNVLRYHTIFIIIGAIAAPILMAKLKPQLVNDMLILSGAAIVVISVVAVLFFRKKPVSACITGFGGIVVCFIISYASFASVSDVNLPTRNFTREIARIVPPDDKLVAYQHISTRFVHYFGKIVPEIQDKSALYAHYQQGNWVIATSEHLEELPADTQLRKVYYRDETKGSEKEDSGGALFHKSAPIIKQ